MESTAQAVTLSGSLTTASAKLKGLVSLLVSYLRQGSYYSYNQPLPTDPQERYIARYKRALPYAKSMTLVLARTDFGTLFKDLDPVERAPFEQNPATWANLVLGVVGNNNNADDPNGDVIERGVRGKVSRQDELQHRNLKVIRIPVKRREWLRKMTQGVDLLTAHKSSFLSAARSQFESMGSLRKMDQLPGGNRGAIVELRKIKGHMEYTHWKPFALDVLDYIMSLNAWDPGHAVPQYTKSTVR